MLRSTILVSALLLSAYVTAEMGELDSPAQALIESLSETQRDQALHPLKTDLRATWSNLPTVMAPPVGILIHALSSEQRKLVHEMLRATMSSQGYSKATAIMWLDDLLREQAQKEIASHDEVPPDPVAVAIMNNRSSGNYAIAFFGTPADNQWGWKLTGHHLAINVTVNGDELSVLPSFYGSDPRIVQDGIYAGYAVLGSEMASGLRLMRSLNENQRKTAVIDDQRPQDVIEGPGRRGSLERYEGLQAKHMNVEQLAILQRLVGEYLRNARPASAAERLDAVGSAGWENIWFSWRGPTDGTAGFYYRIHGQRVLIEYNLQNPNHDHAVVRDPMNDYGEDWLGHHYKEWHPSYKEYMSNLREAAGVE